MKKTTAWILTVMMVLVLMAGCGTNNEQPTEPASQPESDVQQTEESTVQEAEGQDEEPQPDMGIILPDDEFDDEFTEAATEGETEPQEPTSKPTESTVSETDPEQEETDDSSIALPDDEF